MIKACNSFILVTPIFKKTTTSGLILADGVEKKEGQYYGIVISKGSECKYEIKENDKVLFRRSEGIEFEQENGCKFLALKQEWVVAKLED